MSSNLEKEKVFAYMLASVKDIQDVIKDLMVHKNYHLALDFLGEEQEALKKALKLLEDIDDEKYQSVFSKMIPQKLKDIAFAIKFCNNQLIDGDFILIDADSEYKYNKKKKELKIKNLKKLKSLAMSTKEWEFSEYLDKEIKKEEIGIYQA
jgi:hypothetical protein